MPEPRTLRFDSLDAIAHDVRRLRAGHAQIGNWTLAQSCWHMKLPLEQCLHEPTTTRLTDPQRTMHAVKHLRNYVPNTGREAANA